MPSGERKILVVEDNPNMSSLLADMLEVFAVESVRAADGEEALRMINEENVGLVITDLRMPKMSGTELLTVLKETHPDLPVVLISGFSIAEAGDKTVVERADGFLTKPFRMKDIKAILDQHFVA